MKTTMKQLALTLLCLFITNINLLFAQQYKYAPEYDQFVGTWEWSSDGETFRIVITKHMLQHSFYTQEYTEAIIGWHSYTKNGQVVESSMDKAKAQYTTWSDANQNSTLLGGVKMSDTKIWLYFDDISMDKCDRVTLEMVEGKTDELQWKLRVRGRVVASTPDSPPSPTNVRKQWTVPSDLVLKKKVSQ